MGQRVPGVLQAEDCQPPSITRASECQPDHVPGEQASQASPPWTAADRSSPRPIRPPGAPLTLKSWPHTTGKQDSLSSGCPASLGRLPPEGRPRWSPALSLWLPGCW